MFAFVLLLFCFWVFVCVFLRSLWIQDKGDLKFYTLPEFCCFFPLQRKKLRDLMLVKRTCAQSSCSSCLVIDIGKKTEYEFLLAKLHCEGRQSFLMYLVWTFEKHYVFPYPHPKIKEDKKIFIQQLCV